MAHRSSVKTRSTNLEKEIQELRQILVEKERAFLEGRRKHTVKSHVNTNKYNRHLSNDEITRYSHQIFVMKHYKLQVLLKRKSVLLVGCGSVGCVCAMYLVGAGVGSLTIVDNDTVKTTSLHRQIIHKEDDVGQPIATSVYETLRR